MQILRFEDAPEVAPKRKKSSAGWVGIGLVAALFGVSTAFANSTIGINTDNKINLSQDSKGDWSSEKCKSECSIDLVAKENIKLFKFDQDELSGGKNPGSVVCTRILGKVIYLEYEKVSDAFCSYEGSIVSLSRLARLVF